MFLLYILALYLLAGVGCYLYCVYKTYEYTNVISFRIGEEFVGICKYPQWLMFWMRWVAKKLG